MLGAEEMLHLQGVVRRVPVSDLIVDYVASVVRATRVKDEKVPAFVKEWVLWGVGPRGGQSLLQAAQARRPWTGGRRWTWRTFGRWPRRCCGTGSC